MAACQKGFPVVFVTAAALVDEMMEARDEKRLLQLRRELVQVELLIIPSRGLQTNPCRALDELGFVPLSKTGAELLFELISQRFERGSSLFTSNLPFEEWTETFGTEGLNQSRARRTTTKN